MYKLIKRHHGPTGNPRGRPITVPLDMPEQMIAWLKSHIDPKTGLVRADWKRMARELGVSRATIARRMVEVRKMVQIESIVVSNPDHTFIKRTYYRINFSK